LLALDEKALVEMVHIPDGVGDSIRKGTLCISSQVGCSLKCTFCRTGTQKMMRNLTASEVFLQVYMAIQQLNGFEHWKHHSTHLIDNVVLMGQGEPLYNYKNVRQGVEMIMDRFELHPKRITLSTSGVVPNIPRVAKELKCSLAISLHATYDALRDKLVPLNKTWNIQSVLKAVEEYVSWMPNSRHKRVTFEYVMLKDVNDSLHEAKQLAKLIKHLPCHVNLMAFNPWKGSLFTSTSHERIRQFADILKEEGVITTVRQPRGRDISAACGQLKSHNEVKSR
jgi:23S rRNA (adenine2503-C2)-methyltransferase